MSAARITELEEELALCEAKLASLTQAEGSALQVHLPPSGTIEDLNEQIGTILDIRYTPAHHEDGLERGAKEDTFRCSEITLECLHADATNLDCFIHSFLIATCPNFRAGKISGRKYREYATRYRTTVCTRIADIVYANPDFVPLGGKDTAYTVKDLQQELLTPGVPLPDDLVKCLCFYYNINMIIIGPGGRATARMSRLIQGHEDLHEYPPAYVISNKHGGHFEPCRIRGSHRYILLSEEVECIVTTYTGVRVNPMNLARPVQPAEIEQNPKRMTSEEWECIQCTLHNPKSVEKCSMCEHRRPWACLKCTLDNPNSVEKCKMCEGKRPAKGGRRTRRSNRKTLRRKRARSRR